MNHTDNMNHKQNTGSKNASAKKAVPCGVIRDLLILYEDDVCSDVSSELIREHLKDCDNCRRAYDQAAKPLPPVTISQEERCKEDTQFIRTLRKYRKKITLINIITLSFFLLVAAALIKIGWTEFLSSGVFSVPAEDVKITELYQLAGGDIYCTLEVPRLIESPTLQALEIQDKTSDDRTGDFELHFQYPLSVDEEKYLYLDTVSLIFPAEVSGDFYSYPDPDAAYSCASIYYRGKNKNDKLMIWEEGQTLKKAPGYIEEKAILAYQSNGNIPKALEEIKQTGKKFSSDELLRHLMDYYNDLNTADCFPILCSE